MNQILADPTDFGNEPGDGPLRVGGVPGEPDSDANKPSTMCPQAKAQRGALQKVRDLWRGVDAIRTEAYLPKAQGEDTKNYLNRLARSAFYNAFRRSVEGLAGLVFRKDPVLSDDVPDQIVEHWENIDNAGTHGDVFCHDLLKDDLTAGHSAILVEFPKTDGTQDAATEMRGELRPYWVPIKKDDIISWRTTTVDGSLVLLQVVIRECTYEPVGAFGTKEVTRYRVLMQTDMGPAWRLLEERDNAVFEVDAGFYANQDEIPLAEVTSAGRVSIFESDPPLKDLAYLNIAHFQMWSDYNWSIHKTCVPFIFGAGIDNKDEQGNKVPLIVGANHAVLVPEPSATMEYVSHSGEALGSVESALENLKSDMGSLGLAMLAPQKRSAETAEAKRLDKATSDSALAVTARGLQDGIERALQYHAKYLRLDTGGSVEINRDFEGLLMDAPVMQAYAQLVQAGFPPRSVLQALVDGGRIREDEDLDALELEWLAGNAARQAIADEIDDETEDPVAA